MREARQNVIHPATRDTGAARSAKPALRDARDRRCHEADDERRHGDREEEEDRRGRWAITMASRTPLKSPGTRAPIADRRQPVRGGFARTGRRAPRPRREPYRSAGAARRREQKPIDAGVEMTERAQPPPQVVYALIVPQASRLAATKPTAREPTAWPRSGASARSAVSHSSAASCRAPSIPLNDTNVVLRASARTCFAGLGRIALDVEQVVDDLERQAEILRVGRRAPRRLGRGAGADRRAAGGRGTNSAPVLPRWMRSSVSKSICAAVASRSATWPPISPAGPTASANGRHPRSPAAARIGASDPKRGSAGRTPARIAFGSPKTGDSRAAAPAAARRPSTADHPGSSDARGRIRSPPPCGPRAPRRPGTTSAQQDDGADLLRRRQRGVGHRTFNRAVAVAEPALPFSA